MDVMVFVNQTEKETRQSQNFTMRNFAFKRGLLSLMSLVRILREIEYFFVRLICNFSFMILKKKLIQNVGDFDLGRRG